MFEILADLKQGTGSAFCAVPANCQLGFGFCDADLVPLGFNTSSDPRSHKGHARYGKLITSCESSRTIALTFDDGPSENTEELLDILAKANAKATFFVAGNTNGRGSIDQTSKWTKTVKRMVKEGHQVASHTWSHPDLDKLGSDARKVDMFKNERALANVLGKYPVYMRPPYLSCSERHGCLKDMADLGYHVISYSYDSGDWMHADDLDKMKEHIDKAFAEQGQSGNMILIQHDTIRKSAIELTKYLLQRVQEYNWKGAFFCRASSFIADDTDSM
jgi:peptidoglycan/xylan/chitin deacetylase (PgdA/CDA1 family)